MQTKFSRNQVVVVKSVQNDAAVEVVGKQATVAAVRAGKQGTEYMLRTEDGNVFATFFDGDLEATGHRSHRVQVHYTSGDLAGRRVPHEVIAYNCATEQDVAEFLDMLYPVGSTHCEEDVGCFTVMSLTC